MSIAAVNMVRGQKIDPAWQFSLELTPEESAGNKSKTKCKFCNKVLANITRLKGHLLGNDTNTTKCLELTRQHEEQIQSRIGCKSPNTSGKGSSVTGKRKAPESGFSQPPVTDYLVKTSNEEAEKAVARFFMENGIAFHKARSPSYHEMVEAIGKAGPGLKAPSGEKLRTVLLDKVCLCDCRTSAL